MSSVVLFADQPSGLAIRFTAAAGKTELQLLRTVAGEMLAERNAASLTVDYLFAVKLLKQRAFTLFRQKSIGTQFAHANNQ